MEARLLKESDWKTLCSWWEGWRGWVSPPKSFLPDNGTGGLIVEKEGRPIVAGFIYLTNSEVCLVEYIVSDPKYKEKDRKQALELLINSIEKTCRDLGKSYLFSIGRQPNLIQTHKKLGWHIDERPSHEIIKNL